MITGATYVDLKVEPGTFDNRDRRRLDLLSRCPDGSRVIVDIGRRRHLSEDAARWLHDNDHRLAIEIVGEDPDAVGVFVRAARAGDWSAAIV